MSNNNIIKVKKYKLAKMCHFNNTILYDVSHAQPSAAVESFRNSNILIYMHAANNSKNNNRGRPLFAIVV